MALFNKKHNEMKSNIYTLIIFFATIFAVASCENDVWNELPSPVANFFTTYFPGQEVSSYSTSENGSVASVSGGVTVTFNKDNSWTDVNGNGATLPSIFLYDQLPPKLYNYLQETEATSGVYKVTRDCEKYHIELKDTYINYTISTAEIFYPTAGGKTEA